MARKDKAKAAGVSASSFLALKAELSKAEDAFSKAKAGAPSASEPVFADKKVRRRPCLYRLGALTDACYGRKRPRGCGRTRA